jgi:hypothetical protein
MNSKCKLIGKILAEISLPQEDAITPKAFSCVGGGAYTKVPARIGIATVVPFAAGEPCVAVRARALIARWRIIVATAGSTVQARIGRATSQASGAGRAGPARSTSACI